MDFSEVIKNRYSCKKFGGPYGPDCQEPSGTTDLCCPV